MSEGHPPILRTAKSLTVFVTLPILHPNAAESGPRKHALCAGTAGTSRRSAEIEVCAAWSSIAIMSWATADTFVPLHERMAGDLRLGSQSAGQAIVVEHYFSPVGNFRRCK